MVGVSKRVFKIMEIIISKEFKIKKINGGRKRKYSIPILLISAWSKCNLSSKSSAF